MKNNKIQNPKSKIQNSPSDGGDACHVMEEGEILNPHLTELPLHEAILYGDRVLTAKFSKRLSCAIKHLPIRLRFRYEHSTEAAIEAGIAKDPTLVLDGEIFLEGLVPAEEITEKFERWLAREDPKSS
ncbi:hypothetical protein [Nitratifractor salsuginis]|uniref:Thioredoxin-like fold domain-containing protein n=1 Tax=Nitratifractor salsuginis (strain DSM 16511 / JCM 12458 / E9I37-1) TaxID=749222 RepID=E6X128_NITSE|nr:hypothetical protein [Nitratifractor salsuginis]ADV45831.1 hypothetical protein Nitsa_0563 [Nitratifractor salsuginis DSM 16511]